MKTYAKVSVVGVAVAVVASTVCALLVPGVLAGSTLVNPGFETGDLTGWTNASVPSSVAVVEATSDVHSGSYSLIMRQGTGEVTQTLTGLANGTYTVGVWARSTKEPTTCYVEAADFGGPAKRTYFTSSSAWVQVAVTDVQVTNGQLTLRMYAEVASAPPEWVRFDDCFVTADTAATDTPTSGPTAPPTDTPIGPTPTPTATPVAPTPPPTATPSQGSCDDLQDRVDAASGAGGGTVTVSQSCTFSDELILRSNVTLDVPEGVVLTVTDPIGTVKADRITNVTITGGGAIHNYSGSYVMYLEGVTGLTISNITLDNSLGDGWNTRLEECIDVLIDHATILNATDEAMRDGIDLCNVANAEIRYSYIEAGDDGISLKAWRARPTDTNNIHIHHNTIYQPNDAGAHLGIGNNFDMDIHDVYWHDNVFLTPFMYAYKLWASASKGLAYNIYIYDNENDSLENLLANIVPGVNDTFRPLYFDGEQIR